ncbi:hypothetical protein N9Q31_02560 [Pseudomonadales bacterium]|nr:hypothetical protein [Pseudomonadales bacterium]
MDKSLGTVAAPARIIEELLLSAVDAQVSFNFEFLRYYEAEPSTLQLYCECHLNAGELYCRIAADPGAMPADWINLTAPLRLDQVTVPKPWGAEIWYTGIESRGVCSIQNTPLPWLIALSPKHLLGTTTAQDPILLKILAPLQQTVYGDLYLELHEQKIEVYVVTHVDDVAWPNGKGQIRYGFNPDKLKEFESPAAFKQAYLAAVNHYRSIREAIDLELDKIKADNGYALDAIIAPTLAEHWRASLDDELNQQELQRRHTMEAFTDLKELEVGSIIQVQPRTPHSLQHGVRVIEFQSPHYERFILSFGQKVLTQSHWDTETAINRANLDSNMALEPISIAHESGCEVHQIVQFPQFEVRRIRLEVNSSHTLALQDYGILIGVEGEVRVGEQPLTNEDGMLLSALAPAQRLVNSGSSPAILLLAIPST